MKKLLILIFLSISLTGYSQFVFKNGKSTARIDTIATNGNLFYFVNRTTNQICQAQVRNQALVVQNIYTFTDSLTTLRAFRDSINRLKLTLSTKFDYGDTVSILETQYHAAQTYLGKLDKAVNSELLAGKDTNYIKTNWGGSTIYASDGVYMDGDTVKWKKNQFATGGSVILLAHINNDSISYAGIEKDRVTLESGSNTSSANVLILNSYIDINNSEGENSTNLRIDLTGVHYISPPDTTLTTPTHLMTEAQVKREIAAAREWISNGEAINYNYGGRTVVNIGNEGSIHVYDAITNYESILTGYEVIVGDALLYRDGSMRLKVIACSLTDGSPTQGELSSCAGSASMAGQIKLIKDNTTSEMYQIIATGTNWSYIKYTTP